MHKNTTQTIQSLCKLQDIKFLYRHLDFKYANALKNFVTIQKLSNILPQDFNLDADLSINQQPLSTSQTF